LREEVAHSFGPSGEVLRTSEYHPASTKWIELLVEEIKPTVGDGQTAGRDLAARRRHTYQKTRPRKNEQDSAKRR
jgi:hypothetical protein